MMYNVARLLWNITKWLTGIVITFFVGYAANLAVMKVTDIPSSAFISFVNGLFLPGSNRIITLSILIPLFVIVLLTGLITAREEQRNGGRALKNYLRDVVDKNSDLKPVGFSQQSALISVSVPLDDIFIHLYATTDRPRFDLPTEQLKHLEALRSRADLTLAQREEEIQALRVVWHSQMGYSLFEGRQPQNIDVEYVIEQLTARQPGAVMLGSPGSGKSTTMRWLTYHMARARRFTRWQRGFTTLSRLLNRVPRLQIKIALKNALSEKMAPAQIPILVRISDYAKELSKPDSEQQAFQPFFMDYFRKLYPELPKLAERLLSELEKGQCLLLLDGLDEVASDELRRHVADNIATFVAHYSPENRNARRFNRFIITSRIVGYEGSTFANYAHYTLQDLEDEQIEQFLANWCPAVERYQKTFAQGMKKLTPQQTEQANKDGRAQKERLWEALQNNPSIKRLAVNPLMLTILALIQRSGKTLPHRRIELYQIVARTLLDNWNHDTGRRVFPQEELPLAEQMLSCLAYEMHSNDRLLTEAKVKEIASRSMHTFFQQKPTEQKIDTFIVTLRGSSGLFIETGQGFFSFMHRTFQEYFAAQYLLQLPFEQLKQSVTRYSHKTTWHEPLLLLIAYKSTQSSYEEQLRASDLIRIILEANDDDGYDEILHRNLLLAASCVVDCSAWSVQHELQHRISNQIFDLYGDTLDKGRYTALQENIEKIVLLWLKGQPPQESSEAKPPFLDAWYRALCDASQQTRQEGAVHLLAALAPNLPKCPRPVLSILLPPLLQLADVVDMAYPPEHIRKQLLRTIARPATLQVTEYALVTLRLLDEDGPAGWLYKEWLQWNKEKPELLERLTQHAIELDYLLTPAALPGNSSDPNWDKQYEIRKIWRKRAQRNVRELQLQLLQTSTIARLPDAWLFKKLLVSEDTPGIQNSSWQIIWNRVLQEEMERGRSATYLACLDLRILFTNGNKQQLQDIATELQTALSLNNQKPVLALNIMRGFHDPDSLHNLGRFSDLRNFPRTFASSMTSILFDSFDIFYLLEIFDYNFIINELFSLLKQKNAQISTVLICIYSIIINDDKVLSQYRTELTDSLQEFAISIQQQHNSTLEQRLLIKAINRVLDANTTNAQNTRIQTSFTDIPDKRARKITAFKQQEALNKQNVEELLTACIDTRETTKETWQEVAGEDMTEFRISPGTVGNLAWKQLSQQWNMNIDARAVVIQKLDDSNAIICAAAALLLQQSKQFTDGELKVTAQKIMTILRDEDLSRRPLDPPERYSRKIWRLDDVLFETLRVLAE